MRTVSISLSILAAALAAACGSSDDGGCVTSAAVSVTATTATPSSLRVCANGTVTFTNAAAVDVQIASAPHPTHTDCPELNSGVLTPAQTFTATMVTLRTCGYHDHISATQPPPALGTIAVVTSGGGGGGGGY